MDDGEPGREVVGIGYFVANDGSVEEQLHVADLHVVGDAGGELHRGARRDLDAGLVGIDIGGEQAHRDVWRSIPLVKGEEVDHLQSGTAGGDISQPGRESHGLAETRREAEPGDSGTRTGRVIGPYNDQRPLTKIIDGRQNAQARPVERHGVGSL